MSSYFTEKISTGAVSSLTCPTMGCDSQALPNQVPPPSQLSLEQEDKTYPNNFDSHPRLGGRVCGPGPVQQVRAAAAGHPAGEHGGCGLLPQVQLTGRLAPTSSTTRVSCQCPTMIDRETNLGQCPACSFAFCIYCKVTAELCSFG